MNDLRIIKTNKEKLVECMKECESVILSIVVISKGIVNSSTNINEPIDLEPDENIVILNISHTDSYSQNLKIRFNSLYSQLNTKYIFPLQIWKNNIGRTKLSTGNINRYIYNELNKTQIQTSQTKQVDENTFDEIEKLKVNIMIDSVKQNIPKYNYILSPQVIELFSSMCEQMNLEQIYFSEWANVLKQNDFSRLKKLIEEKHKIFNPILVQDSSLGMTKEQIQYFRQYGINCKNTHNNFKKRKYNVHDEKLNTTNTTNTTNTKKIKNNTNDVSNNRIDLDDNNLSFETE